jgi:hypothetical protein
LEQGNTNIGKAAAAKLKNTVTNIEDWTNQPIKPKKFRSQSQNDQLETANSTKEHTIPHSLRQSKNGKVNLFQQEQEFSGRETAPPSLV